MRWWRAWRLFSGKTPEEIIQSIQQVTPAPAVGPADLVPAELQQIISKALEKNRERRFAHIDEMLESLKIIAAAVENLPPGPINVDADRTFVGVGLFQDCKLAVEKACRHEMPLARGQPCGNHRPVAVQIGDAHLRSPAG